MEAFGYDGLDLFGATPPPATADQKQVAQRAQTVAKGAIAAASKVSRAKSRKLRANTSRVASKLKAAGTQLQKVAGTVASAPTAVTKKKPATSAPVMRSVSPRQPSTPTTQPVTPTRASIVSHPAVKAAVRAPTSVNRAVARTAIRGLVLLGGIQDAVDQIVKNLQAYTAALDQLTQVGGVYTAIVVSGDQVTDQTQVAAGNAILDKIQAVFDSFPEDPGNSSDVAAASSAVAGVGQLITQGNAWLQQGTGKTVVSTVKNADGSTDTTYSDGSVTHVDADGNATSSPAGTVPPGQTPPGAPAGTTSVSSPSSVPPKITALSSTSVSQGDIVTVTGTNLSGVTAVDIGGMTAEFSADSPTQLSVMVPMGAQSGVLHAKAPGGTATAMVQVASSADPYASSSSSGGGYGGGGGDSGYGGGDYGGDSGYAAQEGPPQQGSGAGFDDEALAAAVEGTDALIDELLSEGGAEEADEEAVNAESDYADDGSGLDAMGADLIGVAYDLGQARKQMDSLKNVPVGVARIFTMRGMDAIGKALSNAKQPWYRSDLPGDTARKEVQGHLQWHQSNLAKFGDSTAIYSDGADLKEWVLRAFVEENATEEGTAASAQLGSKAWDDYAAMWVEAGQFIASLPPKALEVLKVEAAAVRNAVAGATGGFIEAVTGLPVWAWALIGLGVVGVGGLVVWAVLNSKAGAVAAGVVVKRYVG